MKPTVIIINGFPQTGKDTFCEFASKKYNCINHSTVITIKEIATIMGWDGTKTSNNRKMLSELKDFATKWFDLSMKEMIELISYEVDRSEQPSVDDSVDIIFLHIREPREIKCIMIWCDINDIDCFSLMVKRDAVQHSNHENHADNDVGTMKYDIYISNNSTLSDFSINTLELCDVIMDGTLAKVMRWR